MEGLYSMEVRDAGTNQTKNVIETTIKVVLLGAIVLWSLMIIRPFLVPIIWGIILAVAAEPLVARLTRMMGGRRTLVSVFFVIVFVSALIIPTTLLIVSSFNTVQNLTNQTRAGLVHIPPPPPEVAEWPLVGSYVHEIWGLAQTNLSETLKLFAPQIKSGLKILFNYVGGGLAGILMAIISTCIAGLLLSRAEKSSLTAEKVISRLAGERGPELAELAITTIRGVMLGVVGVALIQALLAAVGMVAIDVPAAGVWVVLVLLVAVCQLPAILVLGPVAAYVFTYAETTPAVIFLVWSILVGSSDNILKPLLMGRGAKIPMLVIFVGSLGGLMHSGIIGLFVGAVILAIMYVLLVAWLNDSTEEKPLRRNRT